MNTKALRKGFGSAAGSIAQISAYHDALTKAADEIDRLRGALRSIAEGNLGPNVWQADYAKIRKVAQDALDA